MFQVNHTHYNDRGKDYDLERELFHSLREWVTYHKPNKPFKMPKYRLRLLNTYIICDICYSPFDLRLNTVIGNRCKEELEINPYAILRSQKMRCLCVVHKFKDITVVAFILSVSCVLSFTLSICFFYARSLVKEFEIEIADRVMQFADWKSGDW